MTMTDTCWPESIREYLDRGGRLTDLTSGETTLIPWLGEFVVQDRRRNGFASLAESIKTTGMDQASRAEYIAGAERVGGNSDVMRWQFQREDAFNKWARELAADEALCERVEEALPRSLVTGMLEDVEAETRPYRLVSEHRNSYVCAVTGETHSGPAIVVRGHGPYVNEVMREVPDLIFSPEAISEALLQSSLHVVDDKDAS